jgi:hypothetical protein
MTGSSLEAIRGTDRIPVPAGYLHHCRRCTLREAP